VNVIVVPVAAFVLAALAAALSREIAGISLGLFLGSVGFATLLVPPFTVAEKSSLRRSSVPAIVSLGIAVVWAFAIGEFVTVRQWLACSIALFAYAYALGGIASLLTSIRFNPFVASALVTLLGLLWLTWPVWLSHALLSKSGDTLVAWLVPAHPLFAINAVLIHFDTWDRLPLAYSRLTVLNQDVSYSLPSAGVLWTTLLHGAVAATAFGLAWLRRRRDETSRRVLALHER
jgi:hypothetical protein